MTIHAAKGLEFPVVVVADLGRKGNTRQPDLLVDGDRVGLRLVGIDNTPREGARLGGRSPPRAAPPTRPRSAASCTWR